jgi:hypothetical protein
MPRPNLVFLLSILPVLLVSCSSDIQNPSGGSSSSASTGGPRVCIPGQQVACPCSGGGMGVQVCNSTGTSLGPCMCGGTTSTGGTGGAGGAGGAASSSNATGSGGGTCVPGSAASCYSGPPGTKNVGICKPGTKLCNPQGTGYGACIGQVLPNAVDLCSTPADDDCSGSNMPCINDMLWTRSAATSYAGFIAVDGIGRTVMASVVPGSVDWGSGPITASGSGALVLSFDTAGKPTWNKVWGDNQSYATAIAVDASNNVLVGGRVWDVVDFGGGPLGAPGEMRCFVVKLSPTGTHLWSRVTTGCASEGIRGIAVDSSGNALVTGRAGGPVDFGGGPLPHSMGGVDMYVIKLDPNGNQLWGKDFGKDFAQSLFEAKVSANAAGEVFLAGDNALYDFGGGPVNGKFFVVKLKADGTFVWSKGIKVQDGNTILVEADTAGGAVASVYFLSNADAGLGSFSAQYGSYVARFDSGGNPIWGKGLAGGNTISDLLVDSAGTIYLGGGFSGTIDFGAGPYSSLGPNDEDAFLARLDSSGSPIGAKVVAGAGTPSVFSFGLAPSGNVIASGQYGGTVDFGNGAGPVTAVNTTDSFLAKFVP